MNKTIIKLLLLLSITFCVLPTWANDKTITEQSLTIILDWFINPDHAPIFVAIQQGFFKQQGLDVKIISPANPDDGPRLVAVGKADLAITYQPQLMIQVDQSLPLTRIATLINHPLNCVMVRKNSGIYTLADLKNKQVSYSSAVIDNALLKIMLEHSGLTLDNVQLINTQYGGTQALLANQLDAVAGVMRNFGPIEMELAGQAARIFNAENYGIPVYDELIIVTQRDKINDPRLPKFISALTQGVQYLNKYPEKSWNKFAKLHPELNNELNKRAWFATLPYFAANPATLNYERYKRFTLFLKEKNLIKSVMPVESYAIEITKN